MGKVFLDMAMSLDGFGTGPDNEDRGLHDGYFGPSGHAPGVIDGLLQTIGAMILGRRAYGDQPDGSDTPYKVPHFVLTRTARHRVAGGNAGQDVIVRFAKSSRNLSSAGRVKHVTVQE